MQHVISEIKIESFVIQSVHLKRDVITDFYLPGSLTNDCHLLLVNDGQDLVKMQFQHILSELSAERIVGPLLCIGIHCGADRKNEYGVVNEPDYKGRGAKAGAYEKFVFEELFPLINKQFKKFNFLSAAFCGFSLGGLSALDLTWRNPRVFTTAGVFSGSLWWRSVSQDALEFDEDKHRIMHQQIRNGHFSPGLKFFFETGTLDETADRNNNGIIDSIDDTLDLIKELKRKGYSDADIAYEELKDGRHDVETWARAFPHFLTWRYGNQNG